MTIDHDKISDIVSAIASDFTPDNPAGETIHTLIDVIEKLQEENKQLKLKLTIKTAERDAARSLIEKHTDMCRTCTSAPKNKAARKDLH